MKAHRRLGKGAAGLALVVVIGATSSVGACDCLGGPPAGSIEEMDRLAAAMSASIIECSPRADFEAQVEPEDPRNPEQMEASFRTWFRLLLSDENVAVDGEALESCLTFLESDERCDGFNGEDGDCNHIFAGVLEGGQRCALREECVSEVCVFGAAACGTCADSAVGQLGEFCGIRVCDEGLFCQYGHPEGAQCETLRGDGELCFDEVLRQRTFFRCEEDLGCGGDDRCHPLVADGGDCAGGLKCDDDLECRAEGDASVCRPITEGEAAGDACNPAGKGCGSTLSTGLACVDQGDGTGLCETAVVVEEGDACDGGEDEDDRTYRRWCKNALTTHFCRIPLEGGEGTCAPRQDPGDDCRIFPCDLSRAGCVVEGGGANAFCTEWPDVGDPCMVVEGQPSCGPELFCNTGPTGSFCSPSPLPTAVASCR
jgi:hypothetical protein